jgi:hypothetical protein
LDRETIQHACDIIFNPTMSELVDEDVKAAEAFQDALRHQVVVTVQQIRVTLQVIDFLMELYNKSRAVTSSSEGKATA